MTKLYKTTIVIISDYDPTYLMEIDELAHDHPVEHQTSNFILFKAKRADLVGGVDVTITDLCKSLQPEDMSIELMKATTEFVSWHCLCIWEQLNGFSGYDNIEYRLHEGELK